jgi:phenylpropionate dioxygenase-like ring-hydroxylating dioxygenase large terminal subunit
MTELSFTDAEMRQLEMTMLPIENAHTLPGWAYTSSAFYEAEMRNIFTREWIGVCRQEAIGQPGDYFCAELVGEPIVILRNKRGEVAAFLRTCRHRGACVVEGRGNARFFRCPFHGWTYNLDGALISARGMDESADFQASEWPLQPLRCEIWQGLVFVNLDADASALAPRLSRLDETLESYQVADLRASGAMVFHNQCNWKLGTEQAMDMYHVPDTHFLPRAANWVGRAYAEHDPDGIWSSLHTTSRDREHPYVTGTNEVKTSFPAIDGLTDVQLGSFSLFLIYPSTIIAVLPQGAMTFFFHPQAADRTRVELNLHFTQAAFEMLNFDECLRQSQEGFIVTNNQDMASARATQRGMQSRFLPPGRFSSGEHTTWELQRYVIQQVAGAALSV